MKIKHGIAAALVALSLGGCATFQALTAVSTATVTATQAVVAGNGYDAAEAGATAFLTFCHASPADATCSAANRRDVIKYTRAGRAARNQLETIILSSCPAGAQTCTAPIPSTLYNVVVAAVTNLKTTPAASYAGAQ